MKKRPGKNFLIITPKNIVEKWRRDMLDHKDINYLGVITKEQFKTFKTNERIDGIVVDEADFFGSPLFLKGRSDLATTLYETIRNKNIQHILLLTATPFRNAPHTIHSLLTYIGKAPIWKDWQYSTYNLEVRPYLPRPAWIPRRNWRKYAVDYALPRIYTAKISDLATVPTQHEESYNIKVKLPEFVEADSVAGEWHAWARAENGKEKLDWIKDYIRGKSKVVIVCRYKEQIATYAKALEKEREVFILTGDTKNPDEMIRLAKESFECVFFIQASIGAGFELPEFSHMIFASLSFSHRDYVQMKGRILRINKLKENWYVHLIGGDKDKSVYKSIIEMEQDYKI